MNAMNTDTSAETQIIKFKEMTDIENYLGKLDFAIQPLGYWDQFKKSLSDYLFNYFCMFLTIFFFVVGPFIVWAKEMNENPITKLKSIGIQIKNSPARHHRRVLSLARRLW